MVEPFHVDRDNSRKEIYFLCFLFEGSTLPPEVPVAFGTGPGVLESFSVSSMISESSSKMSQV